MQQNIPDREIVDDIARWHGFSPDAVLLMLRALADGRGGMAQFSHPEFGGSGQWMRGGMTMIGNMGDGALKARVIALCEELAPRAAAERTVSATLATSQPGKDDAPWWPAELGSPDSSGAQNEVRYAYFAAPRRLAVHANGRMTLYDTGEHRIGGVSQQQGGRASLAFTSQHGPVELASFPIVPTSGGNPGTEAADPAPVSGGGLGGDTLGTLEKLAELHARGILTAEEFSAKKADLLRRL